MRKIQIGIVLILIVSGCASSKKLYTSDLQLMRSFLTNDSIKYWEIVPKYVVPKIEMISFSKDGTCDVFLYDFSSKKRIKDDWFDSQYMVRPFWYVLTKDSLMIKARETHSDKNGVFIHWFKIKTLSKDSLIVLESQETLESDQPFRRIFEEKYVVSHDQITKPVEH